MNKIEGWIFRLQPLLGMKLLNLSKKTQASHTLCVINKRHKTAKQMQASQRHVAQVSENIDLESNLAAPG